MAKVALEKKALSIIPEYMIQQNRPYSATDVYANLHKEFGKTLVTKALETSVLNGILKEKVIGKQKIFYVNQERLEKYDDVVLADYDSKISLGSTRLNQLTSKYKELQSELKDIFESETTEQLKTTLESLLNKNSEIADRIKQLENEGTRESSVAENGKKIMELENKVIAAKQKRKRIAINMINTIWENSNLPKKQLLDTIGVDVKDHEL